jgi:Lrp/AsnC family leucine-responsive transcriptional regulator
MLFKAKIVTFNMIDEIDKKILNLLQDDGRMKYLDIAKKLNKPVSTVHRRIEAMEKTGVIEGYTAIVNPKKVDKGMTAFIMENAPLGEKSDFVSVGQKLSKIPEVQDVHFITGDCDFLVKIKVKDQDEYFDVMQKVSKHFIPGGRGGMMAPKTFKEGTKISL